MHRAEHEVAGVGGLQRDPHRLGIPQLSHQDHVGVLPQGPPQRLRKARRVAADLALGHEALLRHVHKLDRVLDGDDPQAMVVIEVVDHRSQRRALAAPRRARHQHQAAILLSDVLKHRRQPEFGERLDPQRDAAGREAEVALLVEDVDPKPGDVGNGVGKVAAPLALHATQLRLVCHL